MEAITQQQIEDILNTHDIDPAAKHLAQLDWMVKNEVVGYGICVTTKLKTSYPLYFNGMALVVREEKDIKRIIKHLRGVIKSLNSKTVENEQ